MLKTNATAKCGRTELGSRGLVVITGSEEIGNGHILLRVLDAVLVALIKRSVMTTILEGGLQTHELVKEETAFILDQNSDLRTVTKYKEMKARDVPSDSNFRGVQDGNKLISAVLSFVLVRRILG